MLTRTTPLTSLQTPLLPEGIMPEQALFFDIETTGFAADVTTLYLIGCICFQNGQWTLTQWFADDNQSEARILTAFFSLTGQYSCILHYNGTGFDLPYLMKRCARYGYDFQIPAEKSYDLYQKLRPFRSALGLEQMKQKTLEQYLDISRQDSFSGGDLIPYYGRYLKAKYAKLPEESDYREMLLLHNAEDLTGLFSITRLLAVSHIPTHSVAEIPAVADLTRMILSIHLALPYPLPKPVSCLSDGIILSASGHQAVLQVPLCRQELKFFYSNYKDYYYLPEEDMAVHKSVASYVDRDYRTKAKASNCYSRHTGCFVPQYEPLLAPHFKADYNDPVTWLEATEDFCRNTEQLTVYARHLAEHLLTK